MPKIIYKCLYCEQNSAEENEIAEHEKNCYWNPKERACLSCRFYSLDGWGFDLCKVNEVDSEDMPIDHCPVHEAKAPIIELDI